MEEIRQLCEECISKDLYQVIISNPRSKEGISKAKVRPVMIRDELCYQVSETRGAQIFHRNLSREQLIDAIVDYLEKVFRQMEISSAVMQATVLVSKKGKVTVNRKKVLQQKGTDLSHNKTKNYILQEGTPVPFLVDLGVQTAEGKIVRKQYDKFRQINRYLEFIADVMEVFPEDKPINIIDFGCGKSYLTFALYYYMKILCRRNVRIIGLDLKEAVIEHCNELAIKYGYDDLHFITGDVSTYTGEGTVDMVVTLHACDTATDYALEKAVKWGAKVIFSVPCCQHEVNRQLKNDDLAPLLKYGLIKERMSALVTDAVRANLLEEQGYQVQVMEFIDMEHTPKNILIRAIRDGRKKETGIAETAELLHIHTTLQKLFE